MEDAVGLLNNGCLNIEFVFELIGGRDRAYPFCDHFHAGGNFIEVQSLAQLQSNRPVAAEIACASQHKVAQAL